MSEKYDNCEARKGMTFGDDLCLFPCEEGCHISIRHEPGISDSMFPQSKEENPLKEIRQTLTEISGKLDRVLEAVKPISPMKFYENHRSEEPYMVIDEDEQVKYSRPDLMVDTTELETPSCPPTGLRMSDDGTVLIADDGGVIEDTIPPPPAWVEDYNKCAIDCGKQKNELSKVCPCGDFKPTITDEVRGN